MTHVAKGQDDEAASHYVERLSEILGPEVTDALKDRLLEFTADEGDSESVQRFAIADAAVRQFCAEIVRRHGHPRNAAELQQLEPLDNKEHARQAATVCAELADRAAFMGRDVQLQRALERGAAVAQAAADGTDTGVDAETVGDASAELACAAEMNTEAVELLDRFNHTTIKGGGK